MMSGMSKRVVKELQYDASLDDVSAMLDDPAFREQVLADQQVLRSSVDITGDVVTVEQVQAAEGLPSFATKFVGDEITIIQRETWTSATAGPRSPSLRGCMRLSVPMVRRLSSPSGRRDHRGVVA